jgi:hypothetical protein
LTALECSQSNEELNNAKKSISLVLTATALLFTGPIGLLPFAQAQSDDPQCSNRTLRGAYGFSVEGMFLPSGNQQGAVLRAVALTTFDGKGGVTQVDHYVVNGTPQTPPGVAWPASTGTYSVNPDCTGKMTLNVPNLPPFISYFIVVKNGREIRTVLNANAVSSVGVKVE